MRKSLLLLSALLGSLSAAGHEEARILKRAAEVVGSLVSLQGNMMIISTSSAPGSTDTLTLENVRFAYERNAFDTINGWNLFAECISMLDAADNFRMYYGGDSIAVIEKGSVYYMPPMPPEDLLYISDISSMAERLEEMSQFGGEHAVYEDEYVKRVNRWTVFKDTTVCGRDAWWIEAESEAAFPKVGRQSYSSTAYAIDKDSFFPFYNHVYGNLFEADGSLMQEYQGSTAYTDLIINGLVDGTVFVPPGDYPLRKVTEYGAAPSAGEKIFEWKGTGTDGHVYYSGMFEGRVSLLNFSYAKCGPCQFAIEEYLEIISRFEGDDRFVPVYINPVEGPEFLKNYAAKKGLGGIVMKPDEDAQAAGWGIKSFPTLFIIDKAGIVREVKVGSGPGDRFAGEYIRLIEGLLDE